MSVEDGFGVRANQEGKNDFRNGFPSTKISELKEGQIIFTDGIKDFPNLAVGTEGVSKDITIPVVIPVHEGQSTVPVETSQVPVTPKAEEKPKEKKRPLRKPKSSKSVEGETEKIDIEEGQKWISGTETFQIVSINTDLKTPVITIRYVEGQHKGTILSYDSEEFSEYTSSKHFIPQEKLQPIKLIRENVALARTRAKEGLEDKQKKREWYTHRYILGYLDQAERILGEAEKKTDFDNDTVRRVGEVGRNIDVYLQGKRKGRDMVKFLEKGGSLADTPATDEHSDELNGGTLSLADRKSRGERSQSKVNRAVSESLEEQRVAEKKQSDSLWSNIQDVGNDLKEQPMSDEKRAVVTRLVNRASDLHASASAEKGVKSIIKDLRIIQRRLSSMLPHNQQKDMGSIDIPVQGSEKKQEFLDLFHKAFEDLKVKVSTAENLRVLKNLKRAGKEEHFRFFDMDMFAGYLNNLKGKDQEEERSSAVKMIEGAEKELEVLYRARKDKWVKEKELRDKGKSEAEKIDYEALLKDGTQWIEDAKNIIASGSDKDKLIGLAGFSAKKRERSFVVPQNLKPLLGKGAPKEPKQAFFKELDTLNRTHLKEWEKKMIEVLLVGAGFEKFLQDALEKSGNKKLEKKEVLDAYLETVDYSGVEDLKDKYSNIKTRILRELWEKHAPKSRGTKGVEKERAEEYTKEDAQRDLALLPAAIEEKRKWAEQAYAESKNGVTKAQYDTFIEYLNGVLHAAQEAFERGAQGDKRAYKRVAFELKGVKEATWWEEKTIRERKRKSVPVKSPIDLDDAARDAQHSKLSDEERAVKSRLFGKKQVRKSSKSQTEPPAVESKPTSAQPASGTEVPKIQERTYEELVELMDQSELDELVGVAGTGLKLALEESRSTGKSKQVVIDEIGRDLVINEILAPAVMQLLPTDWTGIEKESFARKFSSERLGLFIKEKAKK